ncbi:hypothetical protein AMECASPLE_024391 [Ameca splendens]|uniref:Uncharacterized protein n=1 Tax=Ameca splendens TaxID=208324 RepID=A0ABV1A2C8_9TELE
MMIAGSKSTRIARAFSQQQREVVAGLTTGEPSASVCLGAFFYLAGGSDQAGLERKGARVLFSPLSENGKEEHNCKPVKTWSANYTDRTGKVSNNGKSSN